MTCGRAWPRSSIASASALSCGARRATRTSAWPWSANTFASAAPMPAEAPVIRATGLRIRHARQGPANFAITSCGMGFDLIFSGSSGSRAAQTRVSKHSTQSSP